MCRRERIAQLRKHTPVILPSLLLCDFGNLQHEIERLTEAGVRGLHLDVMDGHFVPNLTYGMPIVAAVRRLTTLPLDVHLMVSDPGRYIRDFYEAGADAITIHVEAADDCLPVLQDIRQLGAAAGLALNPATPLSRIKPLLELCDLVLVMSVAAGFGGQSFEAVALDKLAKLRTMAPHALLEIDGGVNSDTIHDCARAGAQLYVVGSAIFRQTDYRSVIRDLVSRAASTN